MSELNKLDEVNRRSFMASAARGCLGVTIAGSAAELFAPSVHAADPATVAEGGGKAKSVIYLFMAGGMTHLDTFDPPRPGTGTAVRDGRGLPALGVGVCGGDRPGHVAGPVPET